MRKRGGFIVNWKFLKKKKRPCFGFYNASVLPSEAYLVKKSCSTCEDNQKMECFFKSLKPIPVMLGVEVDSEAWR